MTSAEPSREAGVTDDGRGTPSGEVIQSSMSAEQLAQLRARIARNHQPVDRRAEHRVYLNGWNEALDFVVKAIDEIMGTGEKSV